MRQTVKVAYLYPVGGTDGPAEIIGVKVVETEKGWPRVCYEVRYQDGRIEYEEVGESDGYTIRDIVRGQAEARVVPVFPRGRAVPLAGGSVDDPPAVA